MFEEEEESFRSKQPGKRPRPIEEVKRFMLEQELAEKRRKLDAKKREKEEIDDKLDRMEQLEITLILPVPLVVAIGLLSSLNYHHNSNNHSITSVLNSNNKYHHSLQTLISMKKREI